MLINITMARRSLDFSGLSATLFSPLFYALFLIMLILGLNHLGYLLLRSWFFCCCLTPKNIEGPRWLVHYFPTVTLNMMQNSGNKYDFIPEALTDSLHGRPVFQLHTIPPGFVGKIDILGDCFAIFSYGEIIVYEVKHVS